MGLFDNLNLAQAKAELRRQEKAAKLLVERRDLASANLELRQRDMQELRARIKVAPPATKFFY